MDSLEDFVFDDDLAVAPLNKLGWEVETVSWKSEQDWSRFAAVVIRTPWDYQDAPDQFLQVLRNIENATRLENPLDIVQWNLPKTYLREMEQRGVAIVPTVWGERGTSQDILYKVDEIDADELIVKPVVSANADNTFRLHKRDVANHAEELTSTFADRGYMVQPFMQNVIEEGEFSLFYFNGAYSHTILKTPKQGDFRVQEEHGGIIQSVTPDSELRNAGRRSIENLPNLLYARADFVRGTDTYLLMELELIEPALYFRTDPPSADRFAWALNARLRG